MRPYSAHGRAQCDWFVALLGKRKISCDVCSVLDCRIFYTCRVASEQTASKTHQQCHSFVNGTASSWNQFVVSLPSAENEFHGMVSGCLNGIDIETCLEFLTGKEVVLGPIYLGLAQVCSIWFRVCLCVVYYLKFFGVYLNFVYDLFKLGLGLALVLGFVYIWQRFI